MVVMLSLVPSPLLDLDLVTKSQFDSIPDIHSQHDFPQGNVLEIGEIFKKHNVVDTLGLHLLHRHFPLEIGQVPVTTVLDDIVELTKLTPIEEIPQHAANGTFRGQLWYLNDRNRFQAYEYEYGPPIEFPQAFLQEFAEYIRVNNLQQIVALSTSPSSSSTMEYELGTTATVTVHRAPEREQEGDCRIVGWSFRNVRKDGVDILDVNNSDNYQATTTAGNPHKVLYYQGNCSALRTDGPFPFADRDIIETLRKNNFI